MIIHGINKLTLLDYPEHTACTLFTGGCSFRCPFCQNSALILHPDREPVLDMDWLFAFLNKRKRVLQGVCITGGEPTLQKDLPSFIRKIRELGYKIKLDTNGYHPEAVAALLQDELLDAVAMDIKSSPALAYVVIIKNLSEFLGNKSESLSVLIMHSGRFF
ncbi:MAG: anaerobic ribonucleoside-triphosphate reductase activating protein, partial [Eubacterium sp.]|nr:anaerobic ribonucleoside-triphosphate reductase activating protein [Eubacterium sp.]